MILESTTKSVSAAAAAAFGFFLEEGPTPQLEATIYISRRPDMGRKNP